MKKIKLITIISLLFLSSCSIGQENSINSQKTTKDPQINSSNLPQNDQ